MVTEGLCHSRQSCTPASDRLDNIVRSYETSGTVVPVAHPLLSTSEQRR